MAVPLQLRGDTHANWIAANPILAIRELIIVQSTDPSAQPQWKVGDGVHHYNDLPMCGVNSSTIPIVQLEDEAAYEALEIKDANTIYIW